CSPSASTESVGHGSAPLVYGKDDRVEPWQETDAALRTLASSAVAIVEPRLLRFPRNGASGSDIVEVSAAPLRAWDDYCAGTPFVDEPTAASCSGVLIDDDLVL